jgi:Zn-dependent protease with chaperone function
MTGLHPANRSAEPRLFNIVENLSIATGMTTPNIEISESHKLNAFAMGLTPATSSIGVTRGLLLALNDKELEAVIAHELTHIRTLDVRLMTFATIFCGIIFSMGWFLTYRTRELFRQSKAKPIVLLPVVIFSVSLSIVNPGGFPWHVPLLTGLLIMAALLISLGLRFAISRTREFVADLGACELTKNPEALISALAKIHGRDLIPHCDPTVQAMMISAPSEGLFASHPGLEERIDAIVTYAATHLNGLRLAPAAARHLPQADEGEVKSGFSITKMKYPAWVSNPLIVLPAIGAGLLTHYMTSSGVGAIFQLPGLMLDFANAPMTGTVINANSEMHNTLNLNGESEGSTLNMFKNMSLGDHKAMLIEVMLCAGLVFGARYFRGLGFDAPILRKLAGGPSQEMQSDWDDDNAKPDDIRINAAIARASQHVQQVYTPPAPVPPAFGQRPVFGKAPPR